MPNKAVLVGTPSHEPQDDSKQWEHLLSRENDLAPINLHSISIRSRIVSGLNGHSDGFEDAPDLRLLAHGVAIDTSDRPCRRATCCRLRRSSAAASDDVEIVGEVTREQKDKEGRKRAIDLNLLDNKRPRTAPEELETHMLTSVAKAKSVCAPSVEKRTKALT